jgi:vitamin B12/bleomycin/antimicrobial peptide transport system ATP-binding/permease protein
MIETGDQITDQGQLWSRFWASASGFWCGRWAWTAWMLVGSLIAVVVLQLYVQYQFNYWNRDFFDALERRDANALRYEAWLLVPLCTSSMTLAVISVWGRMTTQRRWREWLTAHVIRYWLENGRYLRLAQVQGEHKIPEYRIAEDARVATDAPIDFVLGLLSALFTAVIFIQILWSVGGDFVVAAFGTTIWVPGYLVVSVVLYSALVTGAMLIVGSPLITVIRRKNQTEAELITAAHSLRDVGEGISPRRDEPKVQSGLWTALENALVQWRDLCWQLMRTTVVSHSNSLLAPIIGLVLCAPKFLAGTMTLGELTQAAAAFTLVQSSFNWLVDNYGRVADWISSVDRVGALLLALDQLNHSGHPAMPNGARLASTAVKPIP